MKLGREGQQLFAYTGGKAFDPAKPCIVLLHGAQGDHSVWILQSRWLAHHGYAVLAFDLPGHGRSDGPAPTTVEQMADRIAACLQPLASPAFLLAGHSMGSLIALEVATRLRARAAGVALLGTAFPMRVSEALLAATREDPSRAMAMINVWSHGASIAPFIARPGNPGPGFSIFWQNLRLMQRIEAVNGREVLALDFAACNAYQGGVTAMRALPCPALFVLGAADSMTPPRAAQPLIDAAARKTVIALERTGHALMAENPEGVRRALADFARSAFAGHSA
ncbi:MAG TPA: alpha/beta hydrolase [Burkholderiaceae bacterium]|nr:alpha/beta hydrolase [Burkholderiaceae bacterium]